MTSETIPGAQAGQAADRHGAFPVLSSEQAEVLGRAGTIRSFPAGGVLFRAGDSGYDLMAIISGRVAIMDGYGTAAEREIVEHGAGRFLGELNLLTGQAVYLTAVAREATEVIAVTPLALRRGPGPGADTE